MSDDRITFDEAASRVSLLLKGLNEYDPNKEIKKMSDTITNRVKEILGRELSDIAPYIEVFDNGMVIDGQFTLEELKAIVQVWEEILKEEK